MNATIIHTNSDGIRIRLCTLCQLITDEVGNPDSRFYSDVFLANYYRSVKSSRCKHERPASTPEVSYREKKLRRALEAALELIKEALE